MRTDKSIWSNLSFCLGFCAHCLFVPGLSWMTSMCTTPPASRNSIRGFGGVQVGLYPWGWLPGDTRFSQVLIAILVVEAESIRELWNSPPKGSNKQIGTNSLQGTRRFGDPNMNQMYILSLGAPRPVAERVFWPIPFPIIKWRRQHFSWPLKNGAWGKTF